MKIVTADQMVMIDKHSIDKMGIPALLLMENAGCQIAKEAFRITKKSRRNKSIAVFGYKGNNGGDAFVAVRYLKNEHPHLDTRLILLCQPDELKNEALENYKKIAEFYPDSIIHADTLDKLLETKGFAIRCGLIVDGIFGTGFSGVPKGHVAEAIFFILGLNKPVLSIDIPSGVNGNTGEAGNLAVKADITVTLGLPKLGLIRGLGVELAGKIKVADIGFPDESINSVVSDIECLEHEKMVSLLPIRSENSHKMTFGHLFVLAGSTGFTGAAVLACESALRAGCGMVTLGCPKSLHDIFEIKLTEVITKPLCETEDKTLHLDCLKTVFSTMADRKCNSILVGPGIGKHLSTTELILSLIKESPYPIVADADALNAVASVSAEVFLDRKSEVVITPHPGELSRLLSVPVAEIQSDRIKYTRDFAMKYGVITILKGKNTVIADTNGDIYVNLTGNSGLAKAGSGDVLAGMVGSFIAQGMKPVNAACCAVYFHGLIADTAIKTLGKRGLVASDLIKYLPKILK